MAFFTDLLRFLVKIAVKKIKRKSDGKQNHKQREGRILDEARHYFRPAFAVAYPARFHQLDDL